MTDKDFLFKLNKLKNVKTDEKWLASNRDLLLTQISNAGAAKLSGWQIFVINFQSLMKTSARPAFSLGAFVLLLLVTSVFSHRLFSQAKPNDSLYIARIISVKAKLGTVLDTQERNRLAFQFATNHAQDISTVLANPEFNNEYNQDQIARLNESFEKEISTAQTKISRLVSPVAPLAAEDVVVIADSTSTAGRLEIAEQPEEGSADKIAAQQVVSEINSSAAADSSGPSASSTAADKELEAGLASQMLDEARQSFENKDYGRTLNKLQEIQAIIKEGGR